jgi:hypothetical protein
MSWIHTEDNMKPDVDEFMQRYLYMGAFLTCPVPGNDHSVVPSPWADEQFLRYGPLFDALHARKWVLTANPVSVDSVSTTTKANVFEVPGGLVVPVVFAGDATSAKVTLHGVASGDIGDVMALLPGDAATQKVDFERRGDDFVFTTPVKSGCAMVRLSINK